MLHSIPLEELSVHKNVKKVPETFFFGLFCGMIKTLVKCFAEDKRLPNEERLKVVEINKGMIDYEG